MDFPDKVWAFWPAYKILDKIGDGLDGAIYKIQRQSEIYAVKQVRKKLYRTIAWKDFRHIPRQHSKFYKMEQRLTNEYNTGVAIRTALGDDSGFVNFHNLSTVTVFPKFHTAGFDLFMDYIDGPDLSTFRQKGYNYSFDQLFKFVYQTAKSLHQMHTKTPLIHNDMKPGNIVINSDEKPTIIDFGLSVHSGTIDVVSNRGSPAFMAPEQFAGLKMAIGPETDLYNWAISVHVIFGGKGLDPMNIINERDPKFKRKQLEALAEQKNSFLEDSGYKTNLQVRELHDVLVNATIPNKQYRTKSFLRAKSDLEDIADRHGIDIT